MPSSIKEYWEKREAELGTIVNGPRSRKPSRKVQEEEVSCTTMNDESSTAAKQKDATRNRKRKNKTTNDESSTAVIEKDATGNMTRKNK